MDRATTLENKLRKKTLSVLTLLLLLTVSVTISTTSNPQCLYNREDTLPCMGYGGNIISPGANQYTIHATRIRRGSNGLPICVKREDDQILENITSLKMDNVKFLSSPGAEKVPPENYTNQILVEYNVTCKHDQTAFIQFENFDLEPANCFNKCRDYVHIDAGLDGLTMEYCGNSMTKESFLVGIGQFTLKLRTSFASSYQGFLAVVVCFENGVQNYDTSKRSSCDYTSDSTQVEIVDLSAAQNVQANAKRDSVARVSLTSTEMKVIDIIEKDLFKRALSVARNKKSSINWPPASYNLNKTGDIVDLNELEPPAEVVPVSQSTDLKGTSLRQRRMIRWRRSTRKRIGRQVDSNVDTRTLMVAMMNENACNPIVRTLARDYLAVAQGLDPVLVKLAREVYQQDIDVSS